MKLSQKERAVAIALFSSPSVQAVADYGGLKIAGEPGAIAGRCGEAAKVFVEVGTELKADGQMAAVALAVFCSSGGKFLVGDDYRNPAKNAFTRAMEMLDYLTVEEVKPVEVKAETTDGEEQKSEGDKQVEDNKVDVATEDLELPTKTKELLLSLSTAEIDLTSASKIRAQDKKQSIESLKDIGPQIRKKILEAVDKAIGPEVVA